MRLNRIHSFNKQEDKYIIPFLELYSEFRIVKYEAIPEDGRLNSPDYLIQDDIFVEVKQLHDGEETSRSAHWGIVTNRLKKYLSDSFIKKNIKGLYSIETPRIYKINGSDNFEKVANDIIHAIENNKDTVFTSGITFGISKINDKYNDIYLTSSFGGGFINPGGTVFQNIVQKLKTANKQLGYQFNDKKINTKVVLIVNKYIFADRISEVIEGLSYCYDDLLTYTNINQIWFQQETKEGKFINSLVYSRDFLVKFDKQQIEPSNPDHQQQFELWYWALEKMEGKKPQIWDALKKFFEHQRPEEIFPDPFKRQSMVQFGLWLLEQNRASDAIWLIEKFINDPDPIEPPEDYSDDPTFNYHKRVEEGNEVSIITTVMGHLAWVVQALARKSSDKEPDNLLKAFEFITGVLKGRKNLYTIQQWFVPLVEISNRRVFLLDSGEEFYKSFKKLLIGTKDNRNDSLVVKFGKYKTTGKLLAHVFSYFKDLTTEEVQLIFDNIDADDDLGASLIYFAIYRPEHYKKTDPIGKKFGKIESEIWNYDGAYAQKLLKELITENKEGHQMQSLAWNLWKILKDSPEQFETLKEWIDMLFALPINFSVNPYLEFILEDNIDKHPEACKKWLEIYLAGVSKYVSENGVNEFLMRDVVHIPKTLQWIEDNGQHESNGLIRQIKEMQSKGIIR